MMSAKEDVKNKAQSPAQLEKKYFEEAREWDEDKAIRKDQSEKRGWMAAAALLLVVVLEAVALASLSPLKSVEPFVIRVDNNTGVVDVISTLTETDGEVATSAQEALDKYWLNQYIRHREGYLWESREYDRNVVGLWSGPLVQQDYAAYTDPKKNPRAPVTVYGRNMEVETRVTGVSFIGRETVDDEIRTTALVRYRKTVKQAGRRSVTSNWTATVTFLYLSSPLAIEDRQLNPLGFQVVGYRNDQETIGG